MTNTATDTGNRSLENEPSSTAMSTALLRAFATRDERDEIRGPDYLAEQFLTEDRKNLLNNPAALQWAKQNKMAPGMYEFMIARTAFFDGIVEQGLRENIPQIVFLGAGYDSRPYRFRELIRETQIFELDIHTTQQSKKDKLEQAHILIPKQVTFVPINFNKDRLADVLLNAGFDGKRRALFIWEGVTYYLTSPVVDTTLSAIRSVAPAGSVLCFDYASVSREALQEDGIVRVQHILKSNHPGEKTQFGIIAGTIEAFLAARGYTLKQHLTSDEMAARYLTLRDGSVIGNLPKLLCLAEAEVAA